MKLKFDILLIAGFLFFGNLVVYAQTTDSYGLYPETPRAVVASFCQSDYDGKGLNTFSLKEIARFCTDYDSSSADILIVDKFTVADSNSFIACDNGSSCATVTVHYAYAGTFASDNSGNQFPSFKRQSELITYTLKRIEGRWRISDSDSKRRISADQVLVDSQPCEAVKGDYVSAGRCRECVDSLKAMVLRKKYGPKYKQIKFENLN